MSKYEPCYHKGEKGFMDSDLVLNDIREWLKKTTDSQTLIDTADICLLFGKIENQEKEIERLNNIIENFEEELEREINIKEEDLKIEHNKYIDINSTLRTMLERFKELKGSDKE